MPYSYSQLNMYRRCPKQYEFAYSKKLPRGPIGPAESFGVSVHSTLQKWGQWELAVNADEPAESQLALFSDEASDKANDTIVTPDLQELWHQSFVSEGYASRADAEVARARGEKLMDHFHDWWSKTERDVLAIETGFKVPIDDFTISGRFDRVERTPDGVVVIDYKTSNSRTQKDIDEDLQLSVYAMAVQEQWGEPCTQLSLLFLNGDGATEVITKRSQLGLTDAKEHIKTLCQDIEAKSFAPTPSEKVCKHCPYRNVCDDAWKVS